MMNMPYPAVEDYYYPNAYEKEDSYDLPWSVGIIGLCALIFLVVSL
jgi:hypothetical protein